LRLPMDPLLGDHVGAPVPCAYQKHRTCCGD
jgi:hypothetical protein